MNNVRIRLRETQRESGLQVFSGEPHISPTKGLAAFHTCSNIVSGLPMTQGSGEWAKQGLEATVKTRHTRPLGASGYSIESY